MALRGLLCLAIATALCSTEAVAQETTGAPAAPVEARAGRVAVVLVGDPNDAATSAATRLSAALDALPQPSDAMARALRGDATDSIATVRESRQELSGDEAADAPRLARLGLQADVDLLLVVRRAREGREVVAFSVRHSSYFEGALSLDAVSDVDVRRFVERRLLAAQAPHDAPRGASPETLPHPARARAAAPPTPTSPPVEERDWFEQHWPYLAGGALLVGAAAFVLVFALEGQDDTSPTLRFQPPSAP